jgi:CrcB protein
LTGIDARGGVGEPPAVARLLFICLAGAIGSGARYLVSEWSAKSLGTTFPWGTLFVNLGGSFLIAVITYVGLRMQMSPTLRLTLTTGFVGGFTTYSAFNFETLRLLQEGAWTTGAINVLVTLVGCMIMGLLGLGLGRALVGV